jgi:spore coat protein U-like protein
VSYTRLSLVATLCVCAGAGEIHADSATAVIQVSASVRRNCIIATQPLAYGAYDPVGSNVTSPLDATATIQLTCTKGTSAQIGLDPGANAQGAVRRLTDGSTGFLSYELYQDTGHSIVWTNTGSGILDAGAAPSKQPRPFTVYGRIAGGQDVPVGSYTDSVVATVNF